VIHREEHQTVHFTKDAQTQITKGVYMPRSTFSLEFEKHARDPRGKSAFTDRLFTDVAPVYDSFTLGPVSFFQDARWKRWLVEALPHIPSGPIVDLATGTGGLAFLLADRYPTRRILGVDINAEMLRIADKKNTRPSVAFRKMNMAEIDFPAESLALITGGYALRNSPDLDKLIADVRACLKPGGYAAFLDFSKSPAPPIRIATQTALTLWLSAWSLALHRNLRIYNYIPASLRHFPDRRALGDLFQRHGFELIRRKLFLFGISEVLIARKRT
jgi:ubiquinone/menaquinone biosynthesis methyltransferase